MKTAKRMISVLMAVIIMAGFSLTGLAAEGKREKKTLQFGADGKFSIMHVTDTHLESDNVDASVWLIAKACDKEKPDLVVITGDNVLNSDDPDETKSYIDKLMTVFEERNIPTAVTFGNHDSEVGAMSREDLMAYYNTYSCSVSVDDGEALSGCGTYSLPILSSDGSKVKFNVWVFDSGDYDNEGHYGYVKADQVEWYKAESDKLTAANGGEVVHSIAFQHIIVADVYEALKKTERKRLFSYSHMYNKDEYYMFDPDRVNHGTLTETPCSGYYNDGQFSAMVEKGDVLGIFTGHDHTNAFGVEYKGIEIGNTVSTRYNGDAFSSQYGYRMFEIDENDTSKYTTRVEHWFDMLDNDDVRTIRNSGDDYGYRLALDVNFKGFFQKLGMKLGRGIVSIFSGRQISYPD
ncbi:MAG: metallophosphoesterase [Clostridia bacterium]|nr:metallophosphoesterase [Clostridia bacterium]